MAKEMITLVDPSNNVVVSKRVSAANKYKNHMIKHDNKLYVYGDHHSSMAYVNYYFVEIDDNEPIISIDEII